MAEQMTRRETLKRGLVAASLLALVPEWTLPALAEGDEDVLFTDIPATFSPTNPTGANRLLDLRQIDGLITPNDKFFVIQHFNQPEVDAASYRLKLSGMVDQADRIVAGRSARRCARWSWSRATNAPATARARCRACRPAAASPACRCATC